MRHFGSYERWKAEFSAMGYALGGGSGWVVLAWIPRDGRLVNQYASEHSQAISGGVPILALDMYEHAYHIDFGANARAYVDTFLRNVDWRSVEGRLEDAGKVAPPRPLVQEEFGDLPGMGIEEVREMLAEGKVSSGATPNAWPSGWASSPGRRRSSCIAPTASTLAAARRSRCAMRASMRAT